MAVRQSEIGQMASSSSRDKTEDKEKGAETMALLSAIFC